MSTEIKICNQCLDAKSITEFSANGKYIRNQCKVCVRYNNQIIRNNNKLRNKEYAKLYREKNRDKIAAQKRVYQNDNSVHISEVKKPITLKIRVK
jgi:superfamily II helicase